MVIDVFKGSLSLRGRYLYLRGRHLRDNDVFKGSLSLRGRYLYLRGRYLYLRGCYL